MKNKPWEIQSQFKKEREGKKNLKSKQELLSIFLVAKYLIANFQMEIIQDVENNF